MTPTADDRGVYAFFPDFGLISYSFEGKERWRHPLGPFDNFYGLSSSPVIAGDVVLLLCDQGQGSFLIAVDKATGKQRWKTGRRGINIGWAVPIIYQDQILVFGSSRVDSYFLATGESRWITGEPARRQVMRLREEHDAILVGINTVRADDPQLTVRKSNRVSSKWRVVLDTHARTPLSARLLTDDFRERTLIVVGETATDRRIRQLQARAGVLVAPEKHGRIDLTWLVRELGQRSITGVLVEGGGEVHGAFLAAGLAHRVALFYAPKILGGRHSIRAVGGDGFTSLAQAPRLARVKWRRMGMDLLLTGDLE